MLSLKLRGAGLSCLILAGVLASPSPGAEPAAEKAKPTKAAAAQAADATATVPAQRGHGYRGGRGGGYGYRGGRGAGAARGGGQGGPWRGGGGPDAQFEADRTLFHQLLDNRQAIRRKVKKLDDGVETLTESDDPDVARAIQKHVASMKRRVENGQPIHMRDPLFRAVFGVATKIQMKVKHTKKGVRVVETSEDDDVARLIQAHAEVVSLFLANGPVEVRNNHEVPRPAKGDAP